VNGRLSFLHNRDDGDTQNVLLNLRGNSNDVNALRGSLEFLPNDSLVVTVNAHHYQNNSTTAFKPLHPAVVTVGSVLLLMALASIGLTLWVTWQLEGGAAAVNEAGRMRMQTWRLTSAVQARLPSGEVQALVAQFDKPGLLRGRSTTRRALGPEVERFAREDVTEQRGLGCGRPDDPVLRTRPKNFRHRPLRAVDRKPPRLHGLPQPVQFP
jgi:hypothetical protein